MRKNKKQIHIWPLLFLVSTIIIGLVLWLWKAPIPRIICLCLLFLAQLIDFIQELRYRKESVYVRILSMIRLTFFLLLVIAYIFLFQKNPTAAAISLVAIFFIFYPALGFWGFMLLLSAEKTTRFWLLARVIFGYILTVVAIVSTFSMVYALNVDLQSGCFIVNTEKPITGPDYLYYSAGVFYSNTIVDALPAGINKSWTLAELVISAILHVIVLAAALQPESKD